MNQTLKDTITSIIDEADDLTIATIREDGFPQATTVSYVNDGLAIYFGTSTASQKAKNIARNDKISLTINRPYDSWDEITGISLGGRAVAVTDEDESQKAGELVLRKFPQVEQYMPSEMDMEGELVFFRVDPVIISLLDYSKGFGHTDLIKV